MSSMAAAWRLRRRREEEEERGTGKGGGSGKGGSGAGRGRRRGGRGRAERRGSPRRGGRGKRCRAGAWRGGGGSCCCGRRREKRAAPAERARARAHTHTRTDRAGRAAEGYQPRPAAPRRRADWPAAAGGALAYWRRRPGRGHWRVEGRKGGGGASGGARRDWAVAGRAPRAALAVAATWGPRRGRGREPGTGRGHRPRGSAGPGGCGRDRGAEPGKEAAAVGCTV